MAIYTANNRFKADKLALLSDERLYDREGLRGTGGGGGGSVNNNYDRLADTRESPYGIKRNIGGYLDDTNDYPNRSRSRDRHFSRSISNNNNNNYGDGLDSRATHFRAYGHRNNSQTPFDGPQRGYPSVGSDQLLDQLDQLPPNVNSNTSTTSSTGGGSGGQRGGGAGSGGTIATGMSGRRMTSASTTASGGVSSTVSSPPLKKKRNKKKKPKRSSLRSHSASPSPSRSSSLSSARSHSPSSSSNISSSSPSSRSPSPAKSQSPLSLYSRERKERGAGGLGGSVISAATTTNNTIISTSSQGSNHTPLHNSGATPGSDSSADKDDTRPLAICVRNLPARSTDGLFHEYKKHGKVTMVKVVGQGSDRFAVVCFKKPEDFSDITSVVKAMRKLDGENLGQNRIKLGFGKSMPTTCVWIHGVSEQLTEKSLLWQANRFGTVVNLMLDRHRANALIFYDSVECAQIAVQDLKGRVLSGRKMQVDFASRECQTAFFDNMEMSGQIPPQVVGSVSGGGDRQWEPQRRPPLGNSSTNQWSEFDERLGGGAYDNHTGGGNSRAHNNRYQSRTPNRNYRPQSPIPFQRNTQTGYGGGSRGRASYQRFGSASDTYNEDFAVDRRHRYEADAEYDDMDDERDSCYGRDRSRELSETCSKSYSPISRRSESPKEGVGGRRDGRSTSPYSKSDMRDNSRDKSDADVMLGQNMAKERSGSRRSSDDLHDDWKPPELQLDRRRAGKQHKSSCDTALMFGDSPPPVTQHVARRLSHSKSPKDKQQQQSSATAAALASLKGQNTNTTPQSPTASPCSSSFASPMRTDCPVHRLQLPFLMLDSTPSSLHTAAFSHLLWPRVDYLYLSDGRRVVRQRSDSVLSDSSDTGFVGRGVGGESTVSALKRKRLDSESPDTPTCSSEAIGHLERKKRLLVCVDGLTGAGGGHSERLGSGSNSSQSTSGSLAGKSGSHESLVNSETNIRQLAKLLKRRPSSSGGAT
ncbi:unnamed protein product, partial [Medioppia subpectinata]